jgi:ribonuclease HI
MTLNRDGLRITQSGKGSYFAVNATQAGFYRTSNNAVLAEIVTESSVPYFAISRIQSPNSSGLVIDIDVKTAFDVGTWHGLRWRYPGTSFPEQGGVYANMNNTFRGFLVAGGALRNTPGAGTKADGALLLYGNTVELHATTTSYDTSIQMSWSSIDLSTSTITVHCNVLRPVVDNSTNLGGAANRWNNIYARTSTINTSDIREKQDVCPLENMTAFIKGLRPVRYRWVDGDSGREHYGLIAQEVKDAMTAAGIDDFGGYIRAERDAPLDSSRTEEPEGGISETQTAKAAYNPDAAEEDVVYGLRYEELIAPMISVIQEQQRTIEDLSDRLAKLEAFVLNGRS